MGFRAYGLGCSLEFWPLLEILFGALGVLRWKDSGAIETHISSYTKIVKMKIYTQLHGAEESISLYLHSSIQQQHHNYLRCTASTVENQTRKNSRFDGVIQCFYSKNKLAFRKQLTAGLCQNLHIYVNLDD